MNIAVIETLESRLADIKAAHGAVVPVDELGAVIASLVMSLDKSHKNEEPNIGAEVREMLDFISRAKDELFHMRPKTITDKHIACARDELDAVVASTENAAERFMDAADRVCDLAGEVSGETGDHLRQISTEIFEASSFQDITGQRVTKVVSVLRHIEDRLSALAEAIGDTVVYEDEAEIIFDEAGDVINPDALKQGPQLEGEGNNQDDIDALFANFD